MRAKYEVYINYQLIDLPDNMEFPLTLQTYDVTTFGSISADHSKTIRIPTSERNQRALGHSDILNSGTEVPYRKLPVKVNKGGLEIISRGWCFIVSSNKDYYEITIFYGTYDFLYALENKYLNDLVTDELDHDVNWYNIFRSTFEQYRWTKPYIYPLIEWGDGSLRIQDNMEIVPPYINDGTDIDAQRLLPVLKVKYILEQIILQAGYSYVDADNMLDYFDNKYVNLTNLSDDVTSSQLREAEGEISLDPPQTNFFHHVLLNYEVTKKLFGSEATWYDFHVLQLETITREYFDQFHNANLYYDIDTRQFTRYRVPAPCTLKMRVEISFAPFLHELEGNGNGEALIGIALHQGYPYEMVTPTDTYNQFDERLPRYTMLAQKLVIIDYREEGTCDWYIEFTGSFVYGDYISVVAEITSWPEGASRTFAIHSAFWTFDFPETVALNTGYGFHLTLGKNLPEMLQKDFFKHCMMMRNVVVSPNYYDKIIYLNEFNDVFNNFRDAKDWTDKVDMGSEIELQCIPEIFFKRNHFRYQAEDDFAKTIGAGYFDIDNQNLETSEDFYESPFFVPLQILLEVPGVGIHLLKIRMYDYGYSVIGSNPSMFVLTEDPHPDPLQSYTLHYISEIEQIDYETNNHVYSYFVDDRNALRMQDDMDFAKILPRFHYRLIDILQRYKAIRAIMILNDTDILNFNPLLPIRLEQYGAYFYCNQIIDYIDQETEVELIKLF